MFDSENIHWKGSDKIQNYHQSQGNQRLLLENFFLVSEHLL